MIKVIVILLMLELHQILKIIDMIHMHKLEKIVIVKCIMMGVGTMRIFLTNL